VRIQGLIWRESTIDKLARKHNVYQEEVRMIARQQGVSSRQLVNQWVRERILKDSSQVSAS
jgi:molybdate-binding protein